MTCVIKKTAGLVPNSVDPNQMPSCAVSDVGLCCLLDLSVPLQKENMRNTG